MFVFLHNLRWMQYLFSLKIIVNSSCKQSYHSLEFLVIFNGTSKSLHRLITILITRFQIFNLLKLTKSQIGDWIGHIAPKPESSFFIRAVHTS